MAVTGKVGQGATAVLTSGGSLLATRIKLPTWEIEDVDATNLATTDFKLYVPGELAEPGEAEIEIIYNGTLPTIGTVDTLTVTRPSAGGSLAGTGYVKSIDHGELVSDGLQMATIVFKFDGDTGPAVS